MNLKPLLICIGAVVVLTSCASSMRTVEKAGVVESPMHLTPAQFIGQSFTLASRDTFLHYFFFRDGFVEFESGGAKGGPHIAMAEFWCITNGDTLVLFNNPLMITNRDELIITNLPNADSGEIPVAYQFRSITPSLAVTMDGTKFRRP